MNALPVTCLIRPFNSHASFEQIGIAVSHGEGAYLIDATGQRMFDSISGLWNVPLGYSCESIKLAIARQAQTLPAASLIVATHEAAEKFAQQLVLALEVPSLQAVFLTSGGSEAIESAMKLSRHYFYVSGRPTKRVILSMRGSYHGMTFGALAITGIAEDKWQFGASLPDVHQVSSPSLLLQEGGAERVVADIQAAITYFGEDNIAALVIEPVLAVAGIVPIPSPALRQIRQQCTVADIHLIADEVTTGMFRTGDTFLACSAAGVEPDMAVMAKALTNGYIPMGAVAVSQRIAATLESSAFMHGHTFSGNPLGCAAGVACLKALQGQFGASPAGRPLATSLLAAARHQLDGRPAIAAWRATGGLLGVDLAYAESAPVEAVAQASLKIRLECRRQGVIVRPTYGGRTFNFVPMFIATEQELHHMLAVFASVSADVLNSTDR